ncbi:Multidrug resistance-associated protein 4 [Orchesella cincta]|uniref:Cystic fibrosis transmembrane conductance regulator n=1 Tax=Orchesella cincta TaxID=48709 RepID=A0A1D2NAK6_ORCCI|nr:Multidrug resistance-associated protein 4 [Orchesella cincta]
MLSFNYNILIINAYWIPTSWLLGFFRLGSKRDLELSDLYRLESENKSENLGNRLAKAWREEISGTEQWKSMNKAKNPKNPSLLKALVKVFFWQYAVLGLIAFFEECVLKIAQPIFLGLIIQYCAGEFEDPYGYIFAGGLLLASALYTAHHHPYFFFTQHCGMQIRVATSSLIYRKSLKLSQAAIGKTNVGQMVNLLSNDVNRFDLCVGFLHYLWIAPFQLGLVTYILWDYLGFGWTCLPGVAVLVLFVPFQSQMGRLFGKLRLQVAERTDRRVRTMSEIVNAIRIIKMYAWELPFAKLVGEAREDEISCIRKTAILRAINLSCYYISSKVVVFLTLLTYVLMGNYLNAEKVFVTLSLYNNVRLIITLFFPNAITCLAEALVSIRRLQNFLMMEERNVTPQAIQPLHDLKSDQVGHKQPKTEIGVTVSNLYARWNKDADMLTLDCINLTVKEGQLAAVVGSIGSGKTSLLQALLHELPTTAGSLKINGKLAYTCQEPWIFSGSVRDNILFGLDYEYDRYHRVIQACALSKDLTLLPFQDQTLVGDRGTSLSGGQKGRINLARAVYADADIYLLDDPLSAVDAEVAKHIFENCINGLLKEKARILVTHQLQFLKPADEIILLNRGKIEARGNYKELVKTGINFVQMLHLEENVTPKTDDMQGGNPAQVLKMKGMGHDLSTGSSGFRRSASMSLLEMGVIANGLIPEDFQWEDEPMIVKSYGRQYDSRRDSRPLLPHFRQPKKAYGTFSTGSSDNSGSGEGESLLVPQQQQQHDEISTTGDIGLSLYWKYISAGASCFGLLTKVEERRAPISEKIAELNSTDQQIFITVSEIPVAYNASEVSAYIESSRTFQAYIYSGLVGTLFIVSLIRTAAFLNMCLNSSVTLHKRLFQGVLRAKMRFFELNPAGRILNRFAKDIGTIDDMAPILFDTFEIALQVIGVIIIVSINNVILLAPSLLMGVVFYFIRKFYLKTARSVKRLEARSPVFSHLSTSLYGLTTIRAMRVEQQFEKQFDAHQDLHSASWYLFLATARWLGIFVDWCSVLYIGTVSFSFLFMKSESAAIGLSIASAMSLTGMFQWGVRQSAECENQMVSVERVNEYAELEPEASLESKPGLKPPPSWPSKGEVVFKNLVMRYGNDSPVLKNITCVFKSQEKCGIVGRTGAGKSSLITALFRITEPHKGDIEIDGLSILRLGLHDLRQKISIIPQDPVLFNSTLRRNLDPFGDFKDEEIWIVLEEVYLADSIRECPGGLDTQIAEGGSNFSVGQRQLICLARAILRQNKILVLDEATANVDHETDALIQRTIREKFAKCTVLTIAHRLHTIIDNDRVLVLDAGEIKEFDEPYVLLSNEESALSQLVETTGRATAANLFHMAKATPSQFEILLVAHDRRKLTIMERVLEVNENVHESESTSHTQ